MAGNHKKKNSVMSDTTTLFITGVPLSMMQEVENVSANTEENKSAMLRPVIREWLRGLPDNLKKKPKEF